MPGPLPISGWGWVRPTPCIFKDRDDGVRYMLTHDSDTDTIFITDVPLTAQLFPNREPLFQTLAGPIRLYVEEGELFTEEGRENEEGVQDEPVFTVAYDDTRTTYELTGDTIDSHGDAFHVWRYTTLGLTTVKTDLGAVFFVAPSGEDGVFAEDVFEPGIFF